MANKTAKSFDSNDESEGHPNAEQLLDSASWEARLAKARLQREKALSNSGATDATSRPTPIRPPGALTHTEIQTPKIGPDTAPANSADVQSPTAVANKNLNDRMAQAIQQRQQVLAERAKAEGLQSHPLGQLATAKPQIDKNTIRLAMSGQAAKQPNQEPVQSDLKSAILVAAPVREKSRVLRLVTIAAAVVVGLGAGVVLRDPLLSSSQWVRKQATLWFGQPAPLATNEPLIVTTAPAPASAAVPVAPPPAIAGTAIDRVSPTPVVMASGIVEINAATARLGDTDTPTMAVSSLQSESEALRAVSRAMAPPDFVTPALGQLPILTTVAYSSPATLSAEAGYFELAALTVALVTPPQLTAQDIEISGAPGLLAMQNRLTARTSTDAVPESPPRLVAQRAGTLSLPSPLLDKTLAIAGLANSWTSPTPSTPLVKSGAFSAPTLPSSISHGLLSSNTQTKRPELALPAYLFPITNKPNPLARPEKLTQVAVFWDTPAQKLSAAFDRSQPIEMASFQVAPRTVGTALIDTPISDNLTGLDSQPPTPQLAALKQPIARPESIALQAEPESDLSAYTVFLNAPNNLADSKLTAFAAALAETGYPVRSPKRVGFKITKNNVRFFHPQDAEAAQMLASAVDGKARDFTNYSPAPEVGTIEIWLAGDAPRSAPKRTKRTTKKEDPALTALRAKLLQSLKQGAYLE